MFRFAKAFELGVTTAALGAGAIPTASELVNQFGGGEFTLVSSPWDPTKKDDLVTLSNSDLTAASTDDTDYRGVTSVASYNSGKIAIAFQVAEHQLSYAFVGMAQLFPGSPNDWSPNGETMYTLGANIHSIGVWTDGTIWYNQAFFENPTLACANIDPETYDVLGRIQKRIVFLDLDNLLLWIANEHNVLGNPAEGTGGLSIASGDWHIAADMVTTTGSPVTTSVEILTA